ncbi:MAG: polymer-forming cytoskeletal protein, partial [Syntrophorhabdaceae bacterium]|nr:polymer-forming cytoskeletal protein [Syntrophorhabdaceae bacterium]
HRKEVVMGNGIPIIDEPVEGKIVTVIADDLEIRGTIRFKTSVMLKGVFEGEILSEGLLVVGPTAKVTATISTKTLVSHGEIKGDVMAGEQVVLRETSTHTGDIKTPYITIESGAVFNGTCTMDRGQATAMPDTAIAEQYSPAEQSSPVEEGREQPPEIRHEQKKRQPREKVQPEEPANAPETAAEVKEGESKPGDPF